MKRAQSLSDALAPEPKKRNVAYATYQKLKTDMDRECLTVTWLDCDKELMSGKKKHSHEASMQCMYHVQDKNRY